MPTVVTTRAEEYAALDVALQLRAGVALRPLDPEDVLANVRNSTEPQRRVVADALERHPELVDLCRPPCS